MKKFIAMLLVAASIFTLPCVPFAAEQSNADFEFAAKMGFIDGESFLPDDTITRIQLAEVFYNIVFPTQNITSDYWGSSDFPDVPEDKKHIASAVFGMGVMRGYSDTQFAPDDTVTYNQLVKAMVSFLGYDLQAERMGGWPSGYLTQAAMLRILPGGSVPGDALATFGGVSSMLKAAIGVDFATLDGDGTQKILEGTDYLYYYRNVKTARGTVTGNYLTNIRGEDITSYFGVYIDNVYMTVADGAHGIQNLLGHDVYVYYEVSDGSKCAIYFEKGISNVIEIEAGDISSVSRGTISYFLPGESRAVEAQFSKNAAVIYNGSYLGTYFAADLNPFTSGNVDGSIKLIDSDLDGVYDKIVVTAFNTYVVRDVRNNKIYGYYEISNNINDKVIDVSNYRERNIDIRNVLGEPVEPAAIGEGHIINVCRDKSGNIKEIIVSRDSTEGIILEIEKTGGRISAIKINDASFKVSSAVKMIDSASRLTSGVSARVYFNCEDKIAYVDVDSTFADGFQAGYLVDAGKEGGLSGEVKAMIFTSGGEMVTYTLPERVNINNANKPCGDFLTAARVEGDRAKRQAVLYKTNDEGTLITHVLFADTPTDTNNLTDGFYQFPDRANETYSQVLGTFGSYFALADDVTIFSVPKESDRNDYEEYKIATAVADNLALSRVSAYGTSKSGIDAKILVVSSGDAGTTLEFNAPMFVITKIATTLDDDGNEMIKLSGSYVEGTTYAAGSFIIKRETLLAGCGGSMPKLGDVLRTAHFAETGECGYAVRIFEYSTKKFYPCSLSGSNNPTDENIEAGHRMVFGTVFEKSGNIIKLNVNGSTRQEVHNLTGGYYSIIECKKDRDGDFTSAALASPSCVVDEKFHPGDGSEILIYSRSGTGIVIFVFN